MAAKKKIAVRINGGDAGTCGDIGIGITGLESKPFRAKATEKYRRGKRVDSTLIEEASSRVSQGIEPLDGIHASAEFRAHLARLYTGGAIREAQKNSAAQ